ncbi:MAG: cupredoxin domain-containing protein [Bdellovibrionales bacterium]|nr:cupredoxin domain-containing protein [Bdellovibrionales bacterium]
MLTPSFSLADWTVDFSRRNKEIRKKDYEQTEATKPEKEGFFDFITTSTEPVQELVILNTDRGFVPSTVRAREGVPYRIHVVNVNEKDKNVSFVLDAFSEHHATYFGKIKTFMINPQKEGVFTFQSPETSAQGRLVVYPAKGSLGHLETRTPASE